MLKRHAYNIIAVWLSFAGTLLSQDIHYSQNFLHYQGQNPAHAGAYHSKHRVTASYRSQWNTVPVPYLSMSLYYDSPLKLGAGKDFIGVGIGLDYDKAGDSKLSLTSLNASLNYGFSINKEHRFRIGISPSIGQRRLSEEKLKWDNQWDGEKYKKDLPSRENFEVTGSFYADLAAGLTYRYSRSGRTYLEIGGAFFHLLQPKQQFYGPNYATTGLPVRPVYHAALSIGIGKVMDIELFGQYQEQKPYRERTGSALLRFYLDRNPGIRLNLLAGCGIRLDDAFYPMLGFQYKNWLALASYDVNTSGFRTATNQRGGLELGVQYLFRIVDPVGIYKKCPLY